MKATAIAEAYITFPAREDIPLGGMAWSRFCDAIENAAGHTVCLLEQFVEVFHGIYSAGPVPHFTHAMYLLRAMKFGSTSPPFERLKLAYAATTDAPAHSRNAGALIAHLCAGFPPPLAPPALPELLETLHARHRHGPRNRAGIYSEAAPPLAETGPVLAAKLDALTDDALRHWFRFGRPPLADPGRPAQEVEGLPVRAVKLVAAARTSARLVGAASLVPALDAALTIPPRKRSPGAVPQGGYADVTTRGDPDRLLPSQFALDPDEFVRRFAARELLYFQREDPHEARKPDRVIVLDQGVRTWGAVRLALAGAALALVKADPHKVGGVRLFATSHAGPVPLQAGTVPAVTVALEASDFTTNPAAAFAAAVTEPAEVPRDLIVLTHPRSVPALVEAAEERRPGDRVFALAVADDGTATLSELREAGFAALRSFRLDLRSAVAAKVPETGRPAARRSFGTWTGDVEPIGFPFRPGMVADADVLGFTACGTWLVAGSRSGVLHGIAADGSGVEVLPRPYADNWLSTHIRALVGVTSGIVAWNFDPTGSVRVLSLTHYDFATRKLCHYAETTTILAPACVPQPEHHCVVVFETQYSWVPKLVLDLRAGRIEEFNTLTAAPHLVQAALRAKRRLAPPYNLPIRHAPEEAQPTQPGPSVLVHSKIVLVTDPDEHWEAFFPRANGRPMLKDVKVTAAQLAGPTLALTATFTPAELNKGKLLLFRAPDGRTLMEADISPHAPFALSPDGELLGRPRKRREVAIQTTADMRPTLAVAPPAKLHDQLAAFFTFTPFSLKIFVGETMHEFDLRAGKLAHRVNRGTKRPEWSYRPCSLTEYDQQRFPPKLAAGDGSLNAVVDRLGLVHLVAHGRTLVASFCVRKNLAAAWLPNGTLWGAPALIGGPPHPKAAEHVGRAIAEAAGGEA